MQLFSHYFRATLSTQRWCYRGAETTTAQPVVAAEKPKEPYEKVPAEPVGPKLKGIIRDVQAKKAHEISKTTGVKVEAEKLETDPNTLCDTTRKLADTFSKLGEAVEKIFEKLLNLLAPYGATADDVRATLDTPREERPLTTEEAEEVEATSKMRKAPWQPHKLDRQLSQQERYTALRAYKKINTKDLPGQLRIAVGQSVPSSIINELSAAQERGEVTDEFIRQKAQECGMNKNPKLYKKFVDGVREGIASWKDQPVIEKALPEASAKYGVPVETLVAIISKESRWNALIVNESSGAAGYAQVIKTTRESYQKHQDPNFDPHNARDAIMFTAWNIRESMAYVNKRVNDKWKINDASDVEKIYITHNMGALGYVLYANWMDNKSPENFKKMRYWQREEIKPGYYGCDKRADYAKQVAEVALHFADLSNNS
ncbi:transglycosylase SLT domain-containing protein [Candidatus Gracilibacteria bacterium]|nr:transglycosylase SLT domain-containing protein [Candidatus Gracilibacteria bacterium]